MLRIRFPSFSISFTTLVVALTTFAAPSHATYLVMIRAADEQKIVTSLFTDPQIEEIVGNIEEQADYAGKYKFVSWHCNAPCQTGVVINTVEENVIALPKITSTETAVYKVKLGSTLLIADAGPGKKKKQYFVLTDDIFKKVSFEKEIDDAAAFAMFPAKAP